MHKKRVAVYPAGTEIGLEIHNALRFAKDVKLIGLASVEDHSAFVYETIDTEAPFIDDDNLFDYLQKAIRKYHIEYIFPAHDEAVLRLTQMESQLGIKVVAPSKEAAEICRFKSLTYRHLKQFDFIPKTYEVSEVTEDTLPIFIKPDRGQGSHGAKKIQTLSELQHIRNLDEYILCEYLPAEEYTIACLSDAHANLLFAGQRTRSRVRNGISVSSRNVPLDPKVERIARDISRTLHMTGAWFFQVKKNQKGEYKLLEVAARIAGSMGLHRNQGINFPLLSLYIKDGLPVSVIQNDISLHLDRALITRYKQTLNYNHVYIDFDDTILFENKINPFIMHYLYQCKNKNIALYLITRHAKDIYTSLKEACIEQTLFDEIYHLDKFEKKSSYIRHTDAIFIDDSFAERKDVSQQCKIPVFDLDAIEFLIDWRM
jgi:biotin carboxylase